MFVIKTFFMQIFLNLNCLHVTSVNTDYLFCEIAAPPLFFVFKFVLQILVSQHCNKRPKAPVFFSFYRVCIYVCFVEAATGNDTWWNLFSSSVPSLCVNSWRVSCCALTFKEGMEWVFSPILFFSHSSVWAESAQSREAVLALKITFFKAQLISSSSPSRSQTSDTVCSTRSWKLHFCFKLKFLLETDQVWLRAKRRLCCCWISQNSF